MSLKAVKCAKNDSKIRGKLEPCTRDFESGILWRPLRLDVGYQDDFRFSLWRNLICNVGNNAPGFIRDIHTELADLNKEAGELAAKIQENFEELGI